MNQFLIALVGALTVLLTTAAFGSYPIGAVSGAASMVLFGYMIRG